MYDSSVQSNNCQTLQTLSSAFTGIPLPASFLATDRTKIYSPCRQCTCLKPLGQEGTARALSVFHPPRSLAGSVEEFSWLSIRSAPLLIGGTVKKARSKGQPFLTLGADFTLRFFHWALLVLCHSCVAVMSAPSLTPPGFWPGCWPTDLTFLPWPQTQLIVMDMLGNHWIVSDAGYSLWTWPWSQLGGLSFQLDLIAVGLSDDLNSQLNLPTLTSTALLTQMLGDRAFADEATASSCLVTMPCFCLPPSFRKQSALAAS